MNDHMVPFTYKGKKYVKNMLTGRIMEVADINLPSFNETDSMRAYPNEVRPKDSSDRRTKTARQSRTSRRS